MFTIPDLSMLDGQSLASQCWMCFLGPHEVHAAVDLIEKYESYVGQLFLPLVNRMVITLRADKEMIQGNAIFNKSLLNPRSIGDFPKIINNKRWIYHWMIRA